MKRIVYVESTNLSKRYLKFFEFSMKVSLTAIPITAIISISDIISPMSH